MTFTQTRTVCRPRLNFGQRGISTITAIFLITIMAGLAVSGVTLLRTSQNSETADLQAIRAKQAALAGLEWAKYQIEKAGGACAASTNLAPVPGSLALYTITVSCVPGAASNYMDPGAFMPYVLTAVACNRPLPGPGPQCPNNGAPTDRYAEATATVRYPY